MLYTVDPCGIATEAARATVALGFETFQFEAIVGLAHPENRASCRVLEKLGFAYQQEEITPTGMPASRYRLAHPLPD